MMAPGLWTQNYAPVGHSQLESGLVAAIPIAVLLGLLAFGKARAYVAGLAGLIAALIVASGVFGLPLQLGVAAAAAGAAFGLFPVGWIVLNAIFLYELTVAAGQFDVLKRQIASISSDRRIQVLLIAFGFGAFIEGAAGFGAPVAITGALLAGMGFSAYDAARYALIGNTAPVAFGSLGIPLITLAKITGLDLHALSAMVGRQLPPFSWLVPFWLVAVVDGRRGLKETWPACLVMGTAFATVQFLVSNLHGPWLVDLCSSLTSIGALVVLLRFWSPAGAAPKLSRAAAVGLPASRAERFRPWIPWIILSCTVFAWSLPAVHDRLDALYARQWPIPGLHLAVARMPPLAPVPTAEPALFAFNFLSAAGTALLVAGLFSGWLLGLSGLTVLRVYGRTIRRLRESLATIAIMLAVGFTTRYAGADAAMGLALAGTGKWFGFFSPIIGWLGAALTGSDTSSNVLFGNVQQVAAHRLGLSPVATAAANSSGGVMGKMIDAQSIVVACTATQAAASGPRVRAGEILRSVFGHSLALVLLLGLWVYWLTRS